MWGHQNKALHDAPAYCDDILNSWINEQVQALYNQGLQAIPRDAFGLFQHSLEELLQHPFMYKEQWVGSVRVAMQCKQHHEDGAYLSEQCGMQRWLGLEEAPHGNT